MPADRNPSGITAPEKARPNAPSCALSGGIVGRKQEHLAECQRARRYRGGTQIGNDCRFGREGSEGRGAIHIPTVTAARLVDLPIRPRPEGPGSTPAMIAAAGYFKSLETLPRGNVLHEVPECLDMATGGWVRVAHRPLQWMEL